jgi:tRNA A-37 threonylcarbamoyl transferase component Bud32
MAALSQSAWPELLANRYRVLGSVGRGAIAEVVRARDERTGTEVALKILYAHLRESREVVERFRREVEIVRRIQHPHVLAIHEVVEAEGRLFLVMDYRPGGDLADWLARRARFEAGLLRSLAGQLCGALAAAHRAGVVHRDVKPSNVLCGAGTELDVRLCDFGLARTAELAGLTTANAVLGTPEYMAPEVVTDGHADPRSDIYSLGVMLFEAATGKLPFYGDSPYQLMRQHVDVEAPRARALVPELPEAIDAAIARALAKDPLDRFATADDLAAAMAAGVPASAAIVASPPPASVASRACARCGGWLVDAAAICADCGTTLLRLEYERRGVSVLVIGPGDVGDKIDAWRQVALYKLLEQLPEGSVSIPRGARRAPRVPFYVARGVTEASAAALITELEKLGFSARQVAGWEHPPAELKKKVSVMSGRYAGTLGLLGILQIQNAVGGSGWGFSLLGALCVMYCGARVRTAFKSAQPIVRSPPGRGSGAAVRQLAALLPKLRARQDRRLAARILERLEQIDALERGELAAGIGDRTARVLGALVALDARRDAGAVVSPDAAAAVRELRREETMRVVLRADLLRAVSRLDGLCLARARADAVAAADELRVTDDQIDELARSLEAEAEVDAALARGR